MKKDGKVEKIAYTVEGRPEGIEVQPDDFVVVTFGAMTEASDLGTNETAAPLKGKRDGGAWTLGKKIATGPP